MIYFCIMYWISSFFPVSASNYVQWRLKHNTLHFILMTLTNPMFSQKKCFPISTTALWETLGSSTLTQDKFQANNLTVEKWITQFNWIKHFVTANRIYYSQSAGLDHRSGSASLLVKLLSQCIPNPPDAAQQTLQKKLLRIKQTLANKSKYVCIVLQTQIGFVCLLKMLHSKQCGFKLEHLACSSK